MSFDTAESAGARGDLALNKVVSTARAAEATAAFDMGDTPSDAGAMVQSLNRPEAAQVDNQPLVAEIGQPGTEATLIEPVEATAPRLRNFRFLVAAESMREREMEDRLERLERELEDTGNRLRPNNSFSIRLDAQLDRARLERELDIVESQIGRLRLQRAFDKPSINAPTDAQASAGHSLNLLA